ncbi:hypothetical protein FJQ98_19460 [Lysinibacillus agricola]|uniref:Uncharacterized protein n=1 Tax=Lysinibacillus agricola TaxID=2590012 RepID=A0ABX7AN59_9BACI|nr:MULTISPECIES: hypothetical protein [Lysinibacillus]KOS61981.1 hypothetical protein AN161_15675 [Lysinibacillus sp. FJAT-14222]QQP11370.1 hypothetical protein FJQ98_19460 [Lysinibacillus agricola]
MEYKVKKGCGIGCFGLITLIVIVLIIAASIDTNNKGDKKGAAKKSLDTSLPIEERIENAVLSVLGEKNNMSKSRAVNVTSNDNNVTISFIADESSNNSSSLESDIIDVLESIKGIENLNTVSINAQAMFIDKYGNTSADNALTVSIDITKKSLKTSYFK